MNDIINKMKKSVKSINPWQSMIQTSYDIIKAHGGEIKWETCLPKRQRRQGKLISQIPVYPGNGIPII